MLIHSSPLYARGRDAKVPHTHAPAGLHETLCKYSGTASGTCGCCWRHSHDSYQVGKVCTSCTAKHRSPFLPRSIASYIPGSPMRLADTSSSNMNVFCPLAMQGCVHHCKQDHKPAEQCAATSCGTSTSACIRQAAAAATEFCAR